MYKTILVTGCPRGGTTAVGKILSFGLKTSMLYEPFNEDAGIVEVTEPFSTPGNSTHKHIKGIQNLDLSFKKGLRAGDTRLRRYVKFLIGSRGINTYRFCKINPMLKTIIWKDPIACFLSEYVAEEFDFDVLVTMRNPHAVSGSFKRLNMCYDLHEIYEKVLPLNNKLETLRPFLDSKIPALNSAVLWNMIYTTLLNWADNKKFIFVNTEDLLKDPAISYEKIYNRLNLDFNSRIKNKIIKFHSSDRKQPRGGQSHDFKRNPKSFNSYYSEVLTDDEMKFINSLNNELWGQLKKLSFLNK